MCRNRKMMAALLGLAVMASLAGCSSSGGLVTDSGSGGQQDISKENYLNTEALGQEQRTADNLYKVVTLEKGTFEEAALSQVMKRSYLNIPTIYLDLEGVGATFGEYVAGHMEYVQKGDVIATVYTEVDEIVLNELEMKLQRLQERYQAADVYLAEDLEDLKEEGERTNNGYNEEILEVREQQRQLDYEYEKSNYERQIAETGESISELTRVGQVYEVVAPTEGYVVYGKRYTAGEQLEEGAYISQIMNSTAVYTTTTSQAGSFQYGMDVAFESNSGITPATVVNAGSWILYGNLDTNTAIFRLDFEQELSRLNTTALNNLTLNGNLKKMENVIMVPKAAVTEADDEYFVTLLKEDGSLLKTEFIPGGENKEYYWVLEGLTEGMQIVYN